MTDATSFTKCTIHEKDFFKRLGFGRLYLNTCRHIWYLFSNWKRQKKMHVLLNRYLALCQRSLRNGKFKSRQSSNISA